MSKKVWYEWPESQTCIGCRNAIFLPDVSKYGPSAYRCAIGHYKKGAECSAYKQATPEEWLANLERYPE